MAAKSCVATVLLIGMLPLLQACHRAQPIMNVYSHPIPASAQALPERDVERQIMTAGAELKWQFVRLAPGQLRGTLNSGKHLAVIAVTYTERDYNIALETSTNLRQANGTIHRRYNQWVSRLRERIDNRLNMAGLQFVS